MDNDWDELRLRIWRDSEDLLETRVSAQHQWIEESVWETTRAAFFMIKGTLRNQR